MRRFQNILLVAHCIGDETPLLKHALDFARKNGAALTVLIVFPELSGQLSQYKDKFESWLSGRIGESLLAVRSELKLAESDLPVTIAVDNSPTPGTSIVRRVLRDSHDLLLKDAEQTEEGKGFRALDMQLLRKCPCAVWLNRPTAKQWDEIRVAVAVDPESHEAAGHDLSLELLKLSRLLADICAGELNIVSCWEHPFEQYLRRSSWIQVTEDELLRDAMQTETKRREALGALIAESGVGGKLHLHHIKGAADAVIPRFVAERNIDILVMGTVARTGIPSIIIGNTAENVLQKLSCSLVALKPNGFVSPVKA